MIIAGKEFRHLRHDRFTLILVLFLPIAQLIFYGYAMETRFRNLPIALVNLDSHAGGRILERRISESPLFVIDGSVRTEQEIAAALRRGDIRAGIEIPANFTAGVLERKDTPIRVWVDGADVPTSNYLLAALDALSMRMTIERISSGPEVRIQPVVYFNPAGRTAAFLVPGLIAILVQMICTLLVALSFAVEREKGTLERLLVTRIGVRAIIGGKALAACVVGALESLVLILLMRWLFDIPVSGSVLLLIAAIPLLVLAPVGAGLVIAIKARTQSQAMQLAQIAFLPSVLLSGFVLPREFLNEPFGLAGDLIPTTYLVTLVRGIILRGASAGDLAQPILVAAGFGVGLSLLGYFGLRRSLRRCYTWRLK